MDSKRLTFVCNVCGETVSEKDEPKKLKGFAITAYNELIEWSDFTDDIIDLNEQFWERSSIPPAAGEIRKVKVYFPFDMELGKEFWTLFMPGLSFFNGWNEYPDEVEDSAVVRCQFERILCANSESAWIEIKIKEVLMLTDICEKLPLTKREPYLEDLRLFRNYAYKYDYKHWIEFGWNAQGDIGNWYLLKKYKNERYRLVLYCQWGFHYNYVYCGNIEIPKEEVEELTTLCL